MIVKELRRLPAVFDVERVDSSSTRSDAVDRLRDFIQISRGVMVRGTTLRFRRELAPAPVRRPGRRGEPAGRDRGGGTRRDLGPATGSVAGIIGASTVTVVETEPATLDARFFELVTEGAP